MAATPPSNVRTVPADRLPPVDQPWDGMNPKGTPQIVPDLRVLAVSVTDLRAPDHNPRIGDVEVLRGMLRVFGQRKNITARADGTITAGKHLWQAAQAEGMTHLACIRLPDDDATARAWAIGENRSHDVGTYDDRLLEQELEWLAANALDLLACTGYDPDAILADLDLGTLDLDDPPADGKRGFVPGRRKNADGTVPDPLAAPVPGGDNDPAPPPAAAGAAAGGDIGGGDSTPNDALPGRSRIEDSSEPVDDGGPVLLAVGDLRCLIDRDAYNAWRTDLLEGCDGDRVEAGRNAAVMLGFDVAALTAVAPPVPPLDRR